MLLRIADLETCLRLVVAFWILTAVVLANLPKCDCTPRHVCQSEHDEVICPLHKVARNRCDRYHKDAP